MSDIYFLGLDLGTSGLRALLVAEDGQPVGSSEAHYLVSNPHNGWSEQDPRDWTIACQAALSSLRKTFPNEYRKITAIGVSGHMHGATLLDKTGQVLRPCILWNDTRSHVEASTLDKAKGVQALSGNIVFPGFTAPKLMWVAKEEPFIFAAVDKVLLPAAYLNYWLTGDIFSDMSDSAGTSWLDVGQRGWSQKLLDASGMMLSSMPRLVEGSQIGATLSPQIAQLLGLGSDVVVVGGAGDNAAAACGIGALGEGDGFVSLGTSGVLLVARDGYHPLPASAVHTFCHAVPNTWYQMGVILSATDSLNWLSNITGQKPAELTKALGCVIKGPGQTKFLPYLSGERTPHNDASIRAGFAGISQTTSVNELTQAVIEGVSFALRDCLEALCQAGAKPRRLTAIGGGSASNIWLKILATTLNIPLDIPKAGEFGAALGAARLAICGRTGQTPHQVMQPPQVELTVKPDNTLQEAYEIAYQKYSQGYNHLRGLQ